MSWPTSRRHPRTMAEAFPAVRAYSVEIYRAPRVQWWLGFALAVAIGIAMGFSLVDFVTPDINQQPAAPAAPVTGADAR